MVLLACAGLTSPQRSLSVVIPAFNEAHRLPPTLQASLNYLGLHRETSWELIVVDDGSTDGTAELVRTRGLSERLRLLRSMENRGKGAALAAGALAARGDLILLMDADGATGISNVRTLESALILSEIDEMNMNDGDQVGANGFDSDTDSTTGFTSIGSTSKGSSVGVSVGASVGASFGSDYSIALGSRASVLAARPWRRKLMGYVFSALASASVKGISDTQCGFKLLTRGAAASTLPYLRVDGWAYDVELLYLAQRRGLGIVAVEVPWRDVDGSKIRWHTPISMLVDAARVSTLYRLGVWRDDEVPVQREASTSSFVELT
tara:strand:+ start:154 stop:1116 length:963 start_codon:yes stop_codon:yes gene_type:complete